MSIGNIFRSDKGRPKKGNLEKRTEIDYFNFCKILGIEGVNPEDFFSRTGLPNPREGVKTNWELIRGLKISFYTKDDKIIRKIEGTYIEYGIGPKNQSGICTKIEIIRIPFCYEEGYLYNLKKKI